MLYWAGYSLFAMAGVIMWLAPAVGAVPWIVAFGAGVLLVFYGIFRQDNDDPTGSERRG
jgi:hypothetical protein